MPRFSFTRSSSSLLKVIEDTITTTEHMKVQLLTDTGNLKQNPYILQFQLTAHIVPSSQLGGNSKSYCSLCCFLEIEPV